MNHDFETGLSSQMQVASTVAVGTHAQTVLSQRELASHQHP
jgi:hypothetical protein